MFGSINDEGQSGCSTRVKVLGMDIQIFSRRGPRRAGSMNLALASSTGSALNSYFFFSPDDVTDGMRSCLCLTIHATLHLYVHVQMMTELLHLSHHRCHTHVCAQPIVWFEREPSRAWTQSRNSANSSLWKLHFHCLFSTHSCHVKKNRTEFPPPAMKI